MEHVRIKHLATMRYLCFGTQCDPVGDGVDPPSTTTSETAGTRRRGDVAAAMRVGMRTVKRHAAVPKATVFVLRPRAIPPTGAGDQLVDSWLGPDDLVHLQHRDTGLFLSALPLDTDVGGGNIGLTMVKSPLITEASCGSI